MDHSLLKHGPEGVELQRAKTHEDRVRIVSPPVKVTRTLNTADGRPGRDAHAINLPAIAFRHAVYSMLLQGKRP